MAERPLASDGVPDRLPSAASTPWSHRTRRFGGRPRRRVHRPRSLDTRHSTGRWLEDPSSWSSATLPTLPPRRRRQQVHALTRSVFGIRRQNTPLGVGDGRRPHRPASSSSASMAVAAACFRAKLAGQPAPVGERTARVARRVPADRRRSWPRGRRGRSGSRTWRSCSPRATGRAGAGAEIESHTPKSPALGKRRSAGRGETSRPQAPATRVGPDEPVLVEVVVWKTTLVGTCRSGAVEMVEIDQRTVALHRGGGFAATRRCAGHCHRPNGVLEPGGNLLHGSVDPVQQERHAGSSQ